MTIGKLSYSCLAFYVCIVHGEVEELNRGLDVGRSAGKRLIEDHATIREIDGFWNRFLKDNGSLSLKPTLQPTKKPTIKQTRPPTKQPIKQPRPPTKQPSKQTRPPTKQPTKKETQFPTKQPTIKQTSPPTKQPAIVPTGSPIGTVADVVIREPDLAILEEALQGALLLSALDGDIGLTLFAPTDLSFEQTDLEYVSRLLQPQWILHLRNLLLFHVTDSGIFSSATFSDGSNISMMNGESAVVTVETRGPERIRDVFIDEASVTTADIFATNGIVHKIDSVRFPSFYRITLLDLLDQTPELSILAEFVRTANLEEETTGFEALTLFAPSNTAFGKLPADTLVALRDPANLDLLRNLLLYHLVEDVQPLVGDSFGFFETEAFSLVSLFGPTLQVSFSDDGAVSLNQNTRVETADILVWNGIIHRVDSVLRPPVGPPAVPVPVPVPAPRASPTTVPNASPPPTLTSDPTTIVTVAPAFTSTFDPSSSPNTILDLVLANADLSDLSRALVVAQIANLFGLPGSFFTLFAPINVAFQTLPADDLAKFFTPPWRLHLQNLLLFHATVEPSDLADGTSLEMLNGEMVNVNVTTSGAIFLSSRFSNGAAVTEPKATASNGVVYKIDSLFLPSFIGQDLFDVVEETDSASTLAELIQLAGLEDAVRTGNFTLFAPVNTAFDALEDADLLFLRNPENRNQLRDILLYHVVDDLVPATALSPGATVATVLGPRVNVTIDDNGTILNDRARVLSVDRLASNGIVHFVGSVLVPPASSSRLSGSPQGKEGSSHGKKKSLKTLVNRFGKFIPGI